MWSKTHVASLTFLFNGQELQDTLEGLMLYSTVSDNQHHVIDTLAPRYIFVAKISAKSRTRFLDQLIISFQTTPFGLPKTLFVNFI